MKQKVIEVNGRMYTIARDPLSKNALAVWQGNYDVTKYAKRVYTYNSAYDFIAKVEGRLTKDDSYKTWESLYHKFKRGI